jgi:hypothetical protein
MSSISPEIIDKLACYLDPEELQGDMAFIRDVTDYDMAVNLIKTCGGLYFNVPKITSFRNVLVGYIRDEYNRGTSIKMITLNLGMNERIVRDIIQKYIKPIADNQVSLFSDEFC